MTTHFYTNETPGAPAMNGAHGSLISVFDFCLVTKMGWSKVLSGTNCATYKAPTGNAKYIGVDDNYWFSSATIRIYETLPDNAGVTDNGFGAAPADYNNLYYISKTVSEQPETVQWKLFSDGKLVHFFSNVTTTPGHQDYYNGPSLTTFGEFSSRAPVDTFNTVLMAAHEANNKHYQAWRMTNFSEANPGSLILRAHHQGPGAVACGKRTTDFWNTQTLGGPGGSVYPSAIEGGLLASRVFVCEVNTGIRGRLQGLWAPTHERPFAHGDTFAGSGELAGRTFIALNVGTAYNQGQVLLETSDTWAT